MKEKLKSYVTVLKALFTGLFSKAKSLFLSSSLKTKIYAGIAILFIVLLGVIFFQSKSIKSLKIERDTYRSNSIALLTKTKQYKTEAGLNAATANELQLKLSEFNKYKPDDAALIKTLQIKNRTLSEVIAVNANISVPIHAALKDSFPPKIVYRDKIIYIDTIKTIAINNEWYSMNGYIYNDSLNGSASFNEKLLIGGTIKYKRFLGFLWRTKRIKDKKIDVVSKNPYSKIIEVEFTTISK